MRINPVVVGTDGTDSSNLAVDWAAHEARRRHRPLRILHAFDWDWHETRFPIGTDYIDIAREAAESVAAAAFDRARLIAPEVAIESHTLIGHAAPRLMEAAHDAELLVVGSRGRGGFTGLLLGSVSQRVAMHAACPVVVVRRMAGHVGGPIVAGVDDSSAADLVLETAFRAATAQACPIGVIRAYLPVIPPWLSEVAPPTMDTPEQDAAERTGLEEQLAPWRTKFPDVPVTVVVTHDSAASALVEASRRARLVVVGSRGHGVVTGSLLGSAGLQLLHYAACPVQIVRPHPAMGDGS